MKTPAFAKSLVICSLLKYIASETLLRTALAIAVRETLRV